MSTPAHIDPAPIPDPDEAAPVLPPVRETFRAVVRSCAPRARDFGPSEWEAAESLVEDALAQRPAEVRKQIGTFLKVLRLLPVVRYGRRFPALSARGQVAVLRWLERAPVLLLRRGVWGVRTLSFLAVYGQDGVRREIGYRADPRGWAVRPEAGTAADHGLGVGPSDPGIAGDSGGPGEASPGGAP